MGSAAVLAIALNLIVLHRVDGGEVIVNAEQVTSLRDPVGRLQHLAPSGRCLVYLVDGTFVAVRETCAAVRRQLEP